MLIIQLSCYYDNFARKLAVGQFGLSSQSEINLLAEVVPVAISTVQMILLKLLTAIESEVFFREAYYDRNFLFFAGSINS